MTTQKLLKQVGLTPLEVERSPEESRRGEARAVRRDDAD
jgi:hypothetical protein